MLIIPAIDILKDKVARLTVGDFNQATFYDTTPLEMAKRYKTFGFDWLHLVDLTATTEEKIGVLSLLQEIKKETGLSIEFGGGVRNSDQVEKLLQAGVNKIIIGSLSLKNKIEFEKMLSLFGSERFIISIDSSDEKIFVKGWTENSGVTIYEHIDYCTNFGVKTFLCTDIKRDGTLTGPNFKLYEKIFEKYSSIELIASGGVSCLEDVKKLNEMNFYAAVIGKAIYENRIKLEELVQIGK